MVICGIKEEKDEFLQLLIERVEIIFFSFNSYVAHVLSRLLFIRSASMITLSFLR